MNQQLRKAIPLWIGLMVMNLTWGAMAQVPFTAGNLTNTQNVDALPTSSTATFTQNSTIVGIYAERTGTATTIVANSGSSNTGALYSYGTGANPDRALGSVGSGTAGIFTYGYRLKNQTGAVITSLRVQYAGEQWRNSAAAAQTVTFSYLVSSAAITTTTPATVLPTGYVAVPAMDFTSPVTGGTAGPIDGNAMANRSVKDLTISVSVPDGAEIMLRFYDPDHTGADHGLSIDDLTVTATTTGPLIPTVSLSVNPNAGSEAAATAITVTATASATVTGDQTVNLAVTGTGITAGDYSLSNPTITIPGGATSGSVTFTIVNDTNVEGTETATLTISSPSAGITLGSTTTQNISITDDDAPAVPTVSITATDATGAETASDPITFTVSRTGDLTSPLNVTYTVGGTATNGVDYTPTLTGDVTIPASQSSVAITLTPTDDAIVDANEAVILTLTDATGYDLGGTSSATAVITDNDVAPGVRIRDIQGTAHISPRAGETVLNVPGIVTVLRSNGFWMQDPGPDANDDTSEGIFVFTSSAPGRMVGESVLVSGTVQESRPGNNVQNLTVTQLSSPSVSVVSSGNALPDPVVISSQAGPGVRRIPTNVISNDFPANGDVELSAFDPTEDGLDFYETLEGMRVQINNPVTTGLRSNFGEVYVTADRGAGATGLNARGSLTISGTNTTDINSGITNSDFNPERIQIDDVLYGTGNTPSVNVGTLLNTIVGVVNYDFLSYEVLPSVAPTVSFSNVPLAKETTNLVPTTNQLTIASFNVENLAGNEPQLKYDGLAAGIKNNLGAPDILALEEIQDNNGATNDSEVDATTTLNRLISAIAAAGGPTYQFRQINPVDDQDGGQPGGNIRVGLLFNPARVQFVDRPGGGSTTTTAVSNVGGQPRISASPGRILDTNPNESDSYPGDDFTATRKPLIGEFIFNGQPLYVVVNHFSSRGGSGAISQRFQPPLQAEQGRREEQAKIVNAFVDQLLAVNVNTNVVVLGDFNEFQFLPALQYLKGNVNDETPVLTNLIETLPAAERYTYTFDGNAQALDYILASNFMNNKLDAFDAVHINAEFLDQLSDHDPSLARFNFTAAVTSLSVTVSASPAQILTTETTTLSATVLGGTSPYSYTFSGLGTITANGNTATVSGLPAGVQTFTVVARDATAPTSQTISGTVSVTVMQANAGSFAITGVTTASCVLLTPGQYNVTFTPQYAGLSGEPVSFSVVNELNATTTAGPYTLRLYTDNPVIGLRAVQSDALASFTYNWLAACSTGVPGNTPPTVANPIPPRSATVGQGFSYAIPASTFTDAQTPNELTLSVSGLPAGLSFTAPATISGTPSASGVSTVTVTATDPGSLSVATTFTLTVSAAGVVAPPTGPFAITGVTTASCVLLTPGQYNVTFTPQYAGLSGEPVSFSVVNELNATTNAGPYTLRLYTDNPVIQFRAVQSDALASFTYNWLAACGIGSSRIGVSAAAESVLDIRVIGNPVQNGQVSVEVRGAAGQPLALYLTDMRGQVIGLHHAEQANLVERHTFSVGRHPAGLLLLRATTPTRSQTIKVVKAD